MRGWTREQMAIRAAKELIDGTTVSLGDGLPTLIAQALPPEIEFRYIAAEARNLEPADRAGSDATSQVVDVAIVEANQVSARGDIAWADEEVPRALTGVRANRSIVLIEHVAADGAFNVVEECSLPHRAPGAVDRIITDLAVFDVVGCEDPAEPTGRLRLVETAPGVSAGWVRRWTGARLLGAPERPAKPAAITPNVRPPTNGYDEDDLTTT